jgi:hypothetical protein
MVAQKIIFIKTFLEHFDELGSFAKNEGRQQQDVRLDD